MSEPDDILKGWTLHRCDDGTYDARADLDTTDGYAYHNLGNGRTELSAWVELFDKLCEELQ